MRGKLSAERTHLNEPEVARIAAQIPNSTIIDVAKPPLEVIRHIAECGIILSSSLHGLIIVDSLQIPNATKDLFRQDP